MELRRRMAEAIKRRIGYFLEHHERSFRTEIILVPALVIAIKLAVDVLPTWTWYYQLLATIGLALGFYFVGLVILILVGDSVAHRIARIVSPLKKYEGLFIQTKGHPGRQRAISRIYFDKQFQKFVYRGIAFNDSGNHAPAAAWEAVLATHELVDGDRVFYFAGKSFIGAKYEYHSATFTGSVFTILRFSGRNKFDGGGFDFEWNRIGASRRESFPVQGERIDTAYWESHKISDDILTEGLFVSDPDRKAVFNFARQAGDTAAASKETHS